MSDREFGAIVRSVLGDPPTLAKPSRTGQCLPMSRVIALTYRPAEQTQGEQEHVRGCEHCQRGLAASERHAQHPDWRSLAGRGPAEAVAAARHHLQAFRCARCARLVGVLPAIGAVLERVSMLVWGSPRDSALAWPPWAMRGAGAVGLTPASGSQGPTVARLTYETWSDDRKVVVSCRESDRLLWFDVETGGDWSGDALWRYSVGDEHGREVYQGFLVLSPWGKDGRWYASAQLGPLSAIDDDVPVAPMVMAFPVAVGDLTEGDVSALVESVKAAASDTRSREAWANFVRAHRGNPDLPPAAARAVDALAARLSGDA